MQAYVASQRNTLQPSQPPGPAEEGPAAAEGGPQELPEEGGSKAQAQKLRRELLSQLLSKVQSSAALLVEPLLDAGGPMSKTLHAILLHSYLQDLCRKPQKAFDYSQQLCVRKAVVPPLSCNSPHFTFHGTNNASFHVSKDNCEYPLQKIACMQVSWQRMQHSRRDLRVLFQEQSKRPGCGRPPCGICAGCGHHSASCCWPERCSAWLTPGCEVLPCTCAHRALHTPIRLISLQPGATPELSLYSGIACCPESSLQCHRDGQAHVLSDDDALGMPLASCAGAPLAEACAWVELLLDAAPVQQHAAEEAGSRNSKKRKKSTAEAHEGTPAQRLWQPSQHLLLLCLSTCMQASAAVSASGKKKVSL